MSGLSLGLVVEALVALLLVVTIAYCLVVNRKLEQLRSDQSELKSTIRDLNLATGQAEAAIVTLRTTADTAQETLAGHIENARELESLLSTELIKGEEILSKLAIITRNVQVRPDAPASAAAAPAPHRAAPASGLRASRVGLGLANAQRRAQGQTPAPAGKAPNTDAAVA